MGQIIGGAAKPKRCNLNKLSQLETPAAGEHILVSSDNSMNAAGQGNFDCYIVGDGTTAATALELVSINDVRAIDLFGQTIDLSEATPNKYSIKPSVWKTGTTYSIRDSNIANYKGKSISITANSSSNCQFAFLNVDNAGANNTNVMNFCSGYGLIVVPAENTYSGIIPDDCNALYIRRTSTTSSTDVEMLPSSIVVDNSPYDISGLSVMSNRIEPPAWTNAYARHILVPITYIGKKISITANNNFTCEYAFVTQNIAYSNGTYPQFAPYASLCLINAGDTVEVTVPDGTSYLYLKQCSTNSDADVSLLPAEVKIVSSFKMYSESVIYGDSTVRDAIDDIYTNIRGFETLDISTFTNQAAVTASDGTKYIKSDSSYIISPPINLYKGDSVTIIGTLQSNYNPIIRWLGGAYEVLVPYSSGTSSYSYTANDNIIVRLTGKNSYSFIISRSEERINNIEGNIFDAAKSFYLNALLGKSYIPSYTTTDGFFINADLEVSSAGANLNCYTSPIALKAGETINVLMSYNRNGASIVNLSQSDGTLINKVSYSDSILSGIGHLYQYRATDDCYIVISTIFGHTIFITTNNKVQDYFDSFDKLTAGTGILDFYANRETENKLRQLTWGFNNANDSNAFHPWVDNRGDQGNPPLCLLHFSDIHNNAVGTAGTNADGVKNSDRIIQFYKYYQNFIDDVIHTGDSVIETSDVYGNFPWTQNEDIAKVLNIIGNHDLDGTSDWTYIYGKFIAPYAEGWDVTLPENAATDGKCYYYKDYPTNKVRLIALMDWPISNTTYLNTENTWLQSVLADAKEQGLTVVCAAHVSPGQLDLVQGCTFNSWEFEGYPDSGSAIPNIFADSVDAFIQSGGEFACWICGHTHYDMVGTLHSYPEQLCIIVENAGCKAQYNSDYRCTGTLSQDCFNVMSVDTTLKRVNVMRIGSNFASAMQHKGAFSYDYKQKKLLNCW